MDVLAIDSDQSSNPLIPCSSTSSSSFPSSLFRPPSPAYPATILDSDVLSKNRYCDDMISFYQAEKAKHQLLEEGGINTATSSSRKFSSSSSPPSSYQQSNSAQVPSQAAAASHQAAVLPPAPPPPPPLPTHRERRTSLQLSSAIAELRVEHTSGDEEQGGGVLGTTSATSTTSSTSSPPQDETHHACGVVRAVASTTRYDVNCTIGHALFGDCYKPGRMATAIFVIFSFVAIVSWMLSTLSFWKFIHSKGLMLLMPLGSLFLVVDFILILNRDLAILVLNERDTRIFYFWCVVFCASLVTEVQNLGPYATLFAASFPLVMACLPLIDAAPWKFRMIFNTFASPIGVVMLLLYQVSFYFNWCECQATSIAFFGEINTTTRSLASSALSNITILLALNVAAAYQHPSSLVMIHSRVEALLLSEREATLLRAMDRTASEFSSKSTQIRRNELEENFTVSISRAVRTNVGSIPSQNPSQAKRKNSP